MLLARSVQHKKRWDQIIYLVILICTILVSQFLVLKCLETYYLQVQWVYIAKRDIPPRTKLSQEDIVKIAIPKRLNYLVQETEQAKLIGRYTPNQMFIAAGSIIPPDILTQLDVAQDKPVLKLKPDMTMVHLPYRPEYSYLLENMAIDLDFMIDHQAIHVFEAIEILDIQEEWIALAVPSQWVNLYETCLARYEYKVHVRQNTYEMDQQPRIVEESLLETIINS